MKPSHKPNLLLFYKPYQVMSQFTDSDNRETLARFITHPNFYAAGRLDYDSEGLLLLTNDGQLQHQIANPKNKMPKTYWVQVEGDINQESIARLQKGVELKDGRTRPAKVEKMPSPSLPERAPPIRTRKNIATSWIALTISEGRNRQVRRMTAAVGFPTLRLVRVSIGQWALDGMLPGEVKEAYINMPKAKTNRAKQQGPKNATAVQRRLRKK